MKNVYRIAIGLFMLIFGIIFFVVNFVARSGEASSSSGNDGPYFILVILIAALVVVVVPGIFVLVRLVRR